ncbi:MAG TPA: AAA family ATPase [Bacteroidia bacterium]|nr:AAA family ATPase [Bacteroidia bacterium]
MDYIEINGYKSIKNVRVDLAPINILIGANGSGKSNFISFFDFLNRLYNRKLNEYIALKGGDNKILHKGKKNTDTIAFKMEFGNGQNGYSARLQSGTDGFVFLRENLIYKGNPRDISRAGNEANIKTTDNYRAPYVKKYLSGLRKYHFHDTSLNSPFAQYSNIENDTYYFYEDGMNLAAFMHNIHEINKIVYNRIIKNIQSIAPYFSNFYFAPNKENNVRMQWTDKYSDVVFGANDLSDGTLRFIALSVLFLQPDLPDTIIIDEPELGLHPSAIAKLAGMIKSVSDRGCQVIVATQSTDLISHFLPEDIITVDQVNGETVFNRLRSDNLHQWLEDYTIDDLWKRNIITGGQPNYSL